MKKFILSDLHIGHPEAQYNVMDRAIDYIHENMQPGDEVWGLGDWFHMLENGFDHCLKHPMTEKFRSLAWRIPTLLLPGNHDHELEKYLLNPGLGNPVSPIRLVHPFGDNGIWYCHGHEFDPSVQYLPSQIIWVWNKLHRKITPSRIKEKVPTEKYLIAVYLVYLRASIGLRMINEKEGLQYKGIILGHTHLPFHQESPDLPFLLDDGDMRHSSTFLIEDEAGFHLMQWQPDSQQWRETFIRRPD